MPRKTRIPKAGAPVPPLTRLKLLPANQRQQVADFLAAHSYADTARWLTAEFSLTCSEDSLRSFLSWHALAQREQKRGTIAEQVQELYAKANPDKSREEVREMGIAWLLTEALDSQDRQGFLEVLASDLREKSMRTKASLEERKLSISERRVALLENKAAQADAASAVVQSALSPEEKQLKLRAIFGM